MTAFTLGVLITPPSIASHIRSFSYMGSGCGSLIADKVLRLSLNSPF